MLRWGEIIVGSFLSGRRFDWNCRKSFDGAVLLRECRISLCCQCEMISDRERENMSENEPVSSITGATTTTSSSTRTL